MAYTIYVKYKKAHAAVLNLSFGKDGSVHLIDLLSKHHQAPQFEIATYDFPVNKVGMGKAIKPNEPRFVATHRIKFSHHQSGVFQISGENSKSIVSGFHSDSSASKGIAVDAFRLTQETNDGGPFLTANIWGVQHVPFCKSKSSTAITFSEKEIDYQSMRNKGKKCAFAFMFFHLPIVRFGDTALNNDWIYYSYHHFQKPLLLRVLRESINKGFVVGVTCLKGRSNFDSNFGFTMSGGAGKTDPRTGCCKNIAVIFPKPDYDNDLEYISLDRVSSE